jgi:hypothetical protein
MFRRIRSKLLVSYVLLVALGTVALAAYVLYTFRSFYLTRMREELLGRALAVGDEVADALKTRDLERLRSLAGVVAGHGHVSDHDR